MYPRRGLLSDWALEAVWRREIECVSWTPLTQRLTPHGTQRCEKGSSGRDQGVGVGEYRVKG